MSTHDYIIADASGSAFLADLNLAIKALAENNSSATEPAVMYAHMWWADTTADVLKKRNAANTGWISYLTLSTGALLGQGLGTPASGVLTNCTGTPTIVGTNITGTATGLSIGGNAATATSATTASTAASAASATIATNQSGGTVNAVGGLSRNGTIVFSDTAPTIASGFGTIPSITHSNGSLAFTINVGTGGTAYSGTLTMPAAPNGWMLHVVNGLQISPVGSWTRFAASTTTSITITSVTHDTNAASPWLAGSVLMCIAIPY